MVLIFSLNTSYRVTSGADEELGWIQTQEQRWQIDVTQAATPASEATLIQASMEGAMLRHSLLPRIQRVVARLPHPTHILVTGGAIASCA